MGLKSCRFCSDMTKLGGYSIGIAQIDDELEEKLKFGFCPKFTISQLVSWSDMPDMRCFSIGGMKNQHDAILKSFGLTEKIIISLSRLSSATYSLLLNSCKSPLIFALLNLQNYPKSKSDIATKSTSSKQF